ncbi:hypothetical protein [Streptomyces sp. bgisy104]|uniref:hypothetical protein n=1 Tax=Streptomyces sp. bgisy104 TaxID=3413785 RepID=UPI003EBD4307
MNSTPKQSPDPASSSPSANSTPPRRCRRRSVARHFVRGLSYGTGLALASLLGYWVQQLL